MRKRLRSFETPLAWPHMPCGTHWPVWTDERIAFIQREYTAGAPFEIVDVCVSEMPGPDFTLDDLDEFIAAQGLVRPPDWDPALAWIQWDESLSNPQKYNNGLGPFGVKLYG